VDICDRPALRDVFERHAPGAVLHLAAESHVDRSIDGPDDFVRTNVVGTFTLLEEARRHWRGWTAAAVTRSGSSTSPPTRCTGPWAMDGRFDESSPYDPSSPYSATKAGADHLARAWHRTYGLPTIVTNCSNNYGPYQFPEKLVPAHDPQRAGGAGAPGVRPGRERRDWLHVEDHARALATVLGRGAVGATYLVGARQERRNLQLVHTVCDLVDELAGPLQPGGGSRRDLVRFVEDRPGHDFRYAIDPGRMETELGWSPVHDLETGLRDTVRWYLANRSWCDHVRSGAYQGERLGLATPPS
jgi:dTDP-glucose 4,6-dehydratase